MGLSWAAFEPSVLLSLSHGCMSSVFGPSPFNMSLAQRVLLTWVFTLVFLIMLVLKLDGKVGACPVCYQVRMHCNTDTTSSLSSSPPFRCSGTGSSSSCRCGSSMAFSSSCLPSRWQGAASLATTLGTVRQTCVSAPGTWLPCCSNWASAWRCVPSWRSWQTWSWRLCAYHCGLCWWGHWWSWGWISFLRGESPEKD